MTTTSAADALRDLAHLPGAPGYDGGRVPWNVAIEQRPAAVALPRTAEDVAAVVRAAVAAGLQVAPQGTGHAAAPLATHDLSGAVLLRTTGMDRVQVDPARGVARAESGAIWEPLVVAAAAHGLAGLHGSSPDVGIAGYSLGGGIGWYARRLGLSCNSLLAVELVTADGELVRADETHEPDLFWALRGGGGSFGVVTALEVALFPIDSAYAGWLAWPIEDTEKVLRRWAAWTASAPEHVSTAFRVLRLPPIPEIPEPLRGRALAVVDGAVLGSDEEAEALLQPLRELTPEMDTFGRVPAHTLTRLHQDPEGAAPFVADHCTLDDLSDGPLDAYLAQVGPEAASPLFMAELRQLGGALARPADGGGALSHVPGAATVFAGGMAMTPETGSAARAAAGELVAALRPWSGRPYLNFAEGPTEVRRAFDAGTWRRLTEIRAAVDPGDVFVAGHRVPRAGS